MAIPGRRTPHLRRVHVLPSFSPDHLAAASCKLKSRESSLSPRRRGSRPEESALVLSLDQVFFFSISTPLRFYLVGIVMRCVARSIFAFSFSRSTSPSLLLYGLPCRSPSTPASPRRPVAFASGPPSLRWTCTTSARSRRTFSPSALLPSGPSAHSPCLRIPRTKNDGKNR